MIEIEGKINDLPISILIDSGASYSYVNTNMVEIYKLMSNKLPKHKTVQLATRMKRKILAMVKNCCLEMNEFQTKVDHDIIPLRSYDVLIKMNWLEKYFSFLDCHNKIITYLDEDKNTIQIKGILRPISISKISAIQMKKCFRKGCKLYSIHAEVIAVEKEPSINEYPLLQGFQDVFQDVPRFPLKKDIDFTIDLVPGAVRHQNLHTK